MRYISMKILRDTSDTQTISFLPRFYPSQVNYTLVEEGNNRIKEESNVDTATVSGFLTFSTKFQLNEDNYYSLYVYDASTGELIHRDKVFCTNQDIVGYKMNNDYVEDTTHDNDYVIYGDDNTKPDTPTLISVTEE